MIAIIVPFAILTLFYLRKRRLGPMIGAHIGYDLPLMVPAVLLG